VLGLKIERFEDIESWKEARALVRDVYLSLKECRDFGFRDQIQRAAISVMSNVAEGFERGGNREFIQFLTIARGSLAEVKSLVYAAGDIGYMNETQQGLIHEECNRLGNLINGFIRYLRSTERKR
jgi:four helix bundle protein